MTSSLLWNTVDGKNLARFREELDILKTIQWEYLMQILPKANVQDSNFSALEESFYGFPVAIHHDPSCSSLLNI